MERSWTASQCLGRHLLFPIVRSDYVELSLYCKGKLPGSLHGPGAALQAQLGRPTCCHKCLSAPRCLPSQVRDLGFGSSMEDQAQPRFRAGVLVPSCEHALFGVLS